MSFEVWCNIIYRLSRCQNIVGYRQTSRNRMRWWIELTVIQFISCPQVYRNIIINFLIRGLFLEVPPSIALYESIILPSSTIALEWFTCRSPSLFILNHVSSSSILFKNSKLSTFSLVAWLELPELSAEKTFGVEILSYVHYSLYFL